MFWSHIDYWGRNQSIYPQTCLLWWHACAWHLRMATWRIAFTRLVSRRWSKYVLLQLYLCYKIWWLEIISSLYDNIWLDVERFNACVIRNLWQANQSLWHVPKSTSTKLFSLNKIWRSNQKKTATFGQNKKNRKKYRVKPHYLELISPHNMN